MHKHPNTKQLDALYCMQIRCGERKLVLPRNAIVELKPFAEPEPLQHPQSRRLIKAAPWIIGSVIHRNLPLPVISLEMLLDASSDYERRRARLCIMHGISDALNPPSYAIVCQGFPSLIEVPKNMAEPLAQEAAPADPDANNELIAAQLQLGGFFSAVPDLDVIESLISEALANAKND
jgi:chemotaxis signal transduction protein